MRCMYCGSTEDNLAIGVVCSMKCMSIAVQDALDTATLQGKHRSAVITGGRDYNGSHHARLWLMGLLILLQVSQVVHGDAWGADKWAGSVASSMGLAVKACPADWDTHGRAAGVLRNTSMLRETEQIEAVIAFPGGKGTANMIRQAVGRPYTNTWYPIIGLNGVVL